MHWSEWVGVFFSIGGCLGAIVGLALVGGPIVGVLMLSTGAEGIYRIVEHKFANLKKQLTRIIRIAFGFGILTVHIIQLTHKL